MTTNSPASKRLIVLLTIITLLSCTSIVFDLLPSLRGPIDHLLPSRWPYYPTLPNTKALVPIGLVLLVTIYSKKLLTTNSRLPIYVVTFLSSLALQLSLIYSSSFGLGVIFRRVADPDINGYFSTALKYPNSLDLFQKFPSINTSLDQHAKSHPPGLVTIISILSRVSPPAPHLPSDNPLWTSLPASQKSTALLTAIFLFFTTATLPFFVYLFAVKLFSHQTAVIASILTVFIPSLNFFPLLADPAYAILPTICLCLFLSKSQKALFAAGVVSAFSLFFTLSPLVTTVIIILHAVINHSYRKYLISFIAGFCITYSLPLFLNINLLAINHAALTAQFPREYLIWIIHNPLDFCIFLGIPLAVLLYPSITNVIRQPKWVAAKQLIVIYLFVMGIVIFSGSNRGEAGRVWISFMPIPIAYTANYLQKFPKPSLIQLCLLLLGLQLLAINFSWVPAW